MPTAQIVTLATAALACAIDLRTRRIPNELTFGAAAAGLVYHLATQGVVGGVASVGGWVVGVAVLFAPYALGGMGAGDVKLLGALGAWLGPVGAMWLGLYTGVAGALIALVVATVTGYLPRALRNIWTLLAYWRIAGVRPLSALTLDRGSAPRLAYGTSILAGTVATLWLH
jgi:prepilin peptidase CpaA